MKAYLSEYIVPSAYKRLAERCEIVDNFDHPEEIDAIITRNVPVNRALMEKAKRLKVISVHGVGRDGIDLKAAEELGIAVTNIPGGNARSVAELAVSFMFCMARQLKRADRGLRQGKWPKPGESSLIGREITGKTLGLVGTGNIAQEIAAMMRGGFGMKVLCWNPRRDAEYCENLGFEKVESLEELFSRSDFVSINVLLTPETEKLISYKAFAAANPELILVNTSRGKVVDEEALYDALVSGKIRAAASDVFWKEPPDKDMPLLQMDNFVGTIHIGGSTEEALERVGNGAVDNVFKHLLK